MAEGLGPQASWLRALSYYPTAYLKKLPRDENGEIDVPGSYLQSSLSRLLERVAPEALDGAVRLAQTEIARDALGTVQALRDARSGLAHTLDEDGLPRPMTTKEDASIAAVRVKAAEIELKALRVIDKGGGGGQTNVQVNVGDRNAGVRSVMDDPESHEAWLEMQKKLRGRGKVVDGEAEVSDAE